MQPLAIVGKTTSVSPQYSTQARRQTYQKFFTDKSLITTVEGRETLIMLPSAEFTPEQQLSAFFPPEVRRQKACSFFKWGLINFLLVCYLVIFIAIFWNDWKFNDETCIADLSWWVLGYLFIQVLHILRKISIIIIWNKADDPTIA